VLLTCLVQPYGTAAATAIVPRTSGVEPARSSRHPCDGARIRTGGRLIRAANESPPGTTFCLASGTFTLRRSVALEAGDRLVGRGPRETRIRPTGVATPVVAITVSAPAGAAARIVGVDIGRFRERPGADCFSCGAAIQTSLEPGALLSLARVTCHDNGTVCVSTQTGDINATRLDCYGNGFHDATLQDPASRSASCIKTFGGSLTLTRSFIHDNYWNGIWCDYCDHTTWLIENNRFEHNGAAAIEWEISGELTTDTALVLGNTIKRNGWQTDVALSFTSAGVIITGGRNITIKGNVFRRNHHASLDGSRSECCTAVQIYDDDRASWEPSLQDIRIVRNDVGKDALIGCDFTGVVCRRNA
jgi:hypothetical protein